MSRHLAQRWLHRARPGWASRALGRAVAAGGRLLAARPEGAPPAPTVVVGGLAFGGAGRTPIVAHLAARAAAAGATVAIVGHGYGGRAVAAPRRVERPEAGRDGDEAAWLRRVLPSGVSVWVGADRGAVVGAAAAAGAERIFVDGGLFDGGCPRSTTVAVVDAAAGRRVAPAGPLRLPLDLLDRADVVWLHRVDAPGARPLDGARVESVLRPRCLVAPSGASLPAAWLSGRRVRALSAIGRPSAFEATLRSLGAELAPGLRRADHHRFGSRELARLPTDLPWITTAKDAERLRGFPAYVLHVEVEVVAGAALVEVLAGVRR